MREILFRGKSKGKPEWVYGSLYKEGPQVFILVGGRFYPEPSNGQSALGIMDWYEVFPDSICQFTGLLDKHGRKIFEGDIVKIYYVRLVFDGSVFPPQLANITWNVDECGFRLEGPEFSSTNPDLYPSSHLEVIGNIHDNPELLT